LFDAKFFIVSGFRGNAFARLVLPQPVFFQGGAGTTASNNLPPRRFGEEARTALAAVLG
jgi:hypothetical protein